MRFPFTATFRIIPVSPLSDMDAADDSPIKPFFDRQFIHPCFATATSGTYDRPGEYGFPVVQAMEALSLLLRPLLQAPHHEIPLHRYLQDHSGQSIVRHGRR